MGRVLRRKLVTAIGLAVALFLSYRGALAYATWREAVAPSTEQVLVTRDGQVIPLVQPTAAPHPTMGAPGRPAGDRADQQPQRESPGPILPPERLIIPAIEVDWPVVLATVDHLPRFRGVGWLAGSTFPGASGNLVLFGHRGGQAGTFMRLPELQPGDEFQVVTADTTYHYRVREIFETTPDDVTVLAPSATATATLITCTGPWDAANQTNELRHIVVADLILEAS